MNKNYKNLFTAIFFFLLGCCASAQTAVNYTFATGANASMQTGLGGQSIDMSAGTVTVIGPGLTNYASSTFAIGFDFYEMNGSVTGRVTSFTVATNGTIGFNTLVSSATAVPFGGRGLSAFNAGVTGNDMGTHTTGKVHYKVVGTFPNRVCVIEFLNMSIPRSSGTADATFQVRLYETTGVIEYVYGAMNSNAALTAVKVGFGSGTTANLYSSVDINANTTSTTTVTSNSIGTGAISNLNSPVEGSRRYYRFTPPTVNPPTNTVGAITAGSMVVNNSAPGVATGIYGYAYYYSYTAGGPYTFFTYIANPANNYILTGLVANTAYYWKVYSVSEGSLSGGAEVTGTTLATPNVITSAATGSWLTTTTWTGGVVPSYGDSAVIQAGHVVTINTSPIVAGLNVAGTLSFDATTTRTLQVTGGLTVSTGGIFNPYNGSTGRTVYAYSTVNNSGTIDLSKPASLLYLIGIYPQTVNSSGGIFVGTTGSGTPANTGIIANLYLSNASGATLNTPIIVNTAYNAYSGLMTTNGNLYIDNTQTYSGGTAPGSVAVSRYPSVANGFTGPVNYGASSVVNLTYAATTLGIYNTINTGSEIPTNGVLNNFAMQAAGGIVYTGAADLTVKGTLTLLGGNIDLGSKNITLGSTTAAPGTLSYSSGFINTTGSMTRWFGTTAIASLGLSTGYFPLAQGINNRGFWLAGTPTAGGTVTVKYNDATGKSSLGTPFTENSLTYDVRTNYNWQVTAGNGYTGTGLSMRMQGSNQVGVNVYADMNTSLVNGVAPGTFSPGTLANTDVQANRTGLAATDFNNTFYLAANNAENPIPVTLMSFTAQRTGKVNVISWTTAQEINTSNYVVERSADGRNFAPLAQITAAGNSSVATNYSYVDNNPVIGINYYRLRIVDKDGKAGFSWIRSVRNEGVADVSVYPNPVMNVLTVSISADKAEKGTIMISDINGKVVYSNAITVAQGSNNLPVNLRNVAAGAYIIKVQLSDDVVVKKFNKL